MRLGDAPHATPPKPRAPCAGAEDFWGVQLQCRALRKMSRVVSDKNIDTCGESHGDNWQDSLQIQFN